MSSLISYTTLVALVLVIASAILLPQSAVAQSAAARPDRGFTTGASYSVSDIENISLTNGNLNVAIPLAGLPPMAGGKLNLTVSASYNSKLWNVTRAQEDYPDQQWQPYTIDQPQLSDLGGWRIGGGYRITIREVFQDSNYLVPPPNSGVPEWDRQLMMLGWFKVVLHTPDGGERELRPTGYSAYNGTQDFLRGWFNLVPTGSSYIKYYSFDGTYVTALVKGELDWTLFMPDGTQVVQTPDGIQRIKDTNGNSIKIFSDANGTHYQDELTTREIRVTHDSAANGGLGQSQVHYQTVGGDWMSVAINWGITTVQGKAYATNSWLPFGGELGEGVPCTYHQLMQSTEIYVIREIVFPVTEPGQAARRYTFSYNSDTTETATLQNFKESCSEPFSTLNVTQSIGWGALSEVITPSGAKAKYSYKLDSDEISTRFNVDAIAEETITQKQLIYDSPSVTDTWSYEIGGGGTVINPDNTVTSEAAYPHSPSFSYSNGRAGLVYRSTRPGIVTERHWTTLVFSGGVADSPNGIVSFNPVVDAEYTTLLEGNPAQPVKMSAKTFQHDYNGNVTAVTEYDWFDPSLVSRDAEGVPTGVPGSATVLRTTNTSYYNPAGSASAGNVYAVRALTSGVPSIINATEETISDPAKARFSYDGQSYGSPPTAGNLTRKSVWNNIANDWINTDNTYGLYGNLASTSDGRENVITYGYANPALGLPTEVTVDPENGTDTQTTTTSYDPSTGMVISTTDPNGNISTIDYVNQLLGTVDPFGRPGVVIGPDLGGGVNHRTRTFYADSSRTVTTLADLNTEGDGLLKSQTTSDMLGRVIESRQYENANDFITVRKSYNNQNRQSQTSNPFRAGEPVVWTTTVTDAIGRMVSVTTPDNAVVGTSYYANTTTVTDQAGKQRKSVTDGLGRLIQVYEAPNDANYNYLTSYTYDSLDNLTTVNQGSQTRTFAYDSLKRLVSASNPESGSICYGAVVSGQCQNNGYDNNGNLVIKTDARGVRTNYVYDALNRLTNRNYQNDPTNTPEVTYVYDTLTQNGKGRLTSVSSSVSTYNYAGYDAMGRVTGATQSIGAQNYTISDVDYDLAGHLKTMKYPSGRTITNTYDGAGRLASFAGNLGGSQRTYATGISYSAFGGMKWEQYGTNTALYHKTYYNIRGQMFDTRVSSVNDTWDWNRGRLILYYSGNHQWGGSGTDNNGNVRFAEHWIPPANATLDQAQYLIEDTYAYDSLNRISSVSESTIDIAGGGSWTPRFVQAYTYDRWGNRTINTGTGGVNNKQFTVDPNTNRLGVPSGQSGTMSYDYAGNLTADTYSGSAVTRIYDAENKMTKETQPGSVDAGIYSYDGDGRRVKRVVGGVETWQVYGLGGELIAEYTSNGTQLSKEYGYRNGELLITATVTAGWGAPPSYTGPNPLTTGDQIKLENLTELRTAVNSLRSHAGLSAFNFTVDPNPQQNVTTVKADHIRQLRTALEEARTALGLSTGGYSHPTLTENFSLIYAVDFQELRGQILSAWQSGGGVDIRWLVSDQLGTPRMIFDQTGSLANMSRHDYLPFGEEVPGNVRTGIPGYGSGDSVRQKFTSKERDQETGLDYFLARYYSSAQSRFTGADPVMMTDDRQYDPQRINLYAYCRNNPLAFIDPTGETISFRKDDRDSQKAFDDYEKFINQDPKKYAKEIATLKQLRASDVNYIVVLGGKQESESAEGNTAPDAAGQNIVVQIRNVGGERLDRKGRFAHELEHARQFDSGELAFARAKNGTWYPIAYDIYDEVNAFNATVRVAPPVKDTKLLKSLRDDRQSDADRARILSSRAYPNLKNRNQPTNNDKAWGAKPGELVRPAANRGFFGRVYDPSRALRQ